MSFSQEIISLWFKIADIIPVPKRPVYCFVALTTMKSFEKLVLHHFNSIPASLDQHQFAFRGNRFTVDAISTAIHSVSTHLESNTYIRILFAINWLKHCNKLSGTFTNGSQGVWIGHNTSSPLMFNNGAHQGCMLSPFLFVLYSYDCSC